MTDEEFKKLCDEFNKMAEEIKDVRLIFNDVDKHLHKVCDKMSDIVAVDNSNINKEKTKNYEKD